MSEKDDIIIDIIKTRSSKRIIYIGANSHDDIVSLLKSYTLDIGGILWSCSDCGDEITSLNWKSVIGNPIKMQQYCISCCDAIVITKCENVNALISQYFGVLNEYGVIIVSCDVYDSESLVGLLSKHGFNSCSYSGIWVIWKNKRPISCGGMKKDVSCRISDINSEYSYRNPNIPEKIRYMQFSERYWPIVNSIINMGSITKADRCIVDACFSMIKWMEAFKKFMPLFDYKRIVEVGGGYGEMRHVAHGIGFGGEYTIIDKSNMFHVQDSYLKSVGIGNTNYVDIESDISEVNADVVISYRGFDRKIFDAIKSDVWLLGYNNPDMRNTYITYLRKRSIRRKMIFNSIGDTVYLVGRKTDND